MKDLGLRHRTDDAFEFLGRTSSEATTKLDLASSRQYPHFKLWYPGITSDDLCEFGNLRNGCGDCGSQQSQSAQSEHDLCSTRPTDLSPTLNMIGGRSPGTNDLPDRNSERKDVERNATDCYRLEAGGVAQRPERVSCCRHYYLREYPVDPI